MRNRHCIRTGLKTYSAALLAVVLGAAVLGATPSAVRAQGFEVSGTVLSAVDNQPLPGVNVVELDTDNGTTTDVDGEFELVVSGPNAALQVSFVGFETQVVPVNNTAQHTIILEESTAELDGLVVTAFGVERQERALGYAVGTVSGDDLSEVRETNVANALAGKVAGVMVSKPATGPSGSSRVIIRGISSLEGNNQPLYVVDGVPIDNSNLGSAGMWGGVDRGDGISTMNPDDIDELTVLKGPAAAALYGSRAQNGVILITTKSGGALAAPGGGLGVEYNSNLTFDDALVEFTDYQTVYGQGRRGSEPTTVQEALETGQLSWGAPLDGRPVIQFDGVERPYSLVDNKLDQFYRSGLTATNTLALSGGIGQTSFRFSGSRLSNSSIVPNSGMDRTSLTLRGSSRFGRLSADVKANYVKEDVDNRTRLSDSPGNPNYTIAVLPPNVDPESLKPGHVPGNEFQELQYRQDVFGTNAYWAANQFVNDDSRDRLIGFAQLRYDLTDWLDVRGQVGQDWYTSRSRSVTPYGTAYRLSGDMTEAEARVLERNADFLVTADRPLSSSLGLNAAFGGNRLRQQFEQLTLSGSGFSIPGLETVSNLANQTPGYSFWEKAINSLYGSAEISYQNYAFVTVTGRNDWSSTLPDENNSYFYPSVSASFVFSDAFVAPSWLTFGKLRGSWAAVGGDTDPYRLALTYQLLNFTHNGQPLGVIGQTAIPLANLKPSETVGSEVGFDLRFLDNRFGVDFTWYQQKTTNQILSTTVPASSGFSAKVINAGALENTGVELLLSTTPVRSGGFTWNLNFNFASNSNEVVELTEDLETLTLDQSRTQTAFITADVGEPYGTIKGWAYQRDDNGNIVLNDAGLPVRSEELEILGVAAPDWSGGLSNSFRFRNFELSSLIHFSMGGEIFSATNANAYSAGLHKETLVGRAECEANGGYDTPCWVPPGVDAEGNPNTVATYPDTYYSHIAGQIAEEFVYDASYIKLRELQLSYRIPSSLLRGSPVRLATISLVGRNLWLIHSKVPNLDPESTYNNTNAQGLELAGVPPTRSIGFNLHVRL